jgi:hypothetical protein
VVRKAFPALVLLFQAGAALDPEAKGIRFIVDLARSAADRPHRISLRRGGVSGGRSRRRPVSRVRKMLQPHSIEPSRTKIVELTQVVLTSHSRL